ncbi:MAG: hypothetical protein LBP73_01040, partial [Clostridiales Family XIII bacterium]|nr:hypothetical protein [Clostridiales Family XIII bacterium]
MNDERIARLADALIGAEQRTGVSEGPVRINDRFFAFVRTPLFDRRLHVYLPDDFTDMSEEESRIKYPSSNRPKIIKADERGAACFTFDMVDSPLNEDAYEYRYIYFKEYESGERTDILPFSPRRYYRSKCWFSYYRDNHGDDLGELNYKWGNEKSANVRENVSVEEYERVTEPYTEF